MGTQLRLLIVEDSEDDMLLLLDLLRQHDYNVIYQRVETAKDMIVALDDSQSWDIIICDYVIPGFGAPKALPLLKEKGLDIPFIVMSGSIDEVSAVTVLKAGAHDFVLKDRMARLIPAIEREIREANARRKQRQTEIALRRSEARFRVLTMATSQAIWITNKEGKVDSDLPSWRALTGQSVSDIQGWGWLNAVHLDDHDRVLESWLDAVAAKKLYEVEMRVLTAKGDYEYFLARGVPVLDDNGEIMEWVGTHTDISHRHRMEEERKRNEEERDKLLLREQAARREAEISNRIKDDFFAVLSHELRTPLNPILGWARLLRCKKFDPEETDYALETIERNTNLLTQLINDLLDISRVIRGQMSLNVTKFSLQPLIFSVLETVRLAAEAKSLQMQIAIASTEGIVNGDEVRLQQVVWNLLSNAVKFTSQGGTIEVSLTEVGTYAQFQVKDSGIGIKNEFLPYVFDYFRQEYSGTTRQFGGLGLGLAIVRQIVELHGGTVKVESPGSGMGATFTVQIPLLQTSDPMTSNKTSLESKVDLSGIKVLVVDDNPDTRNFIVFALEQENAVVSTAESGFDAVKAFERSIPDILVSDIGMPDMDGYMLIRQLRQLPAEQGGQVKAIALTAYAAESDRQEAVSAGFQKHIPKPVDLDALVNAIATLVNEKS
jgi:PAS domain S-box-containing protein